MSEFKVEKGVEIPPARTTGTRRRAYARYPFGEMEVGDSFFVDDDDPSTRTRVMSAASERLKRCGTRFVTRAVDGGVRVWRVE